MGLCCPRHSEEGCRLPQRGGWVGPQRGAEHPAGPPCSQNKYGLVQLAVQPLHGAGQLCWQARYMPVQPPSILSPPWEAARCPALSLKPKQGPESCHPLHSQSSAPVNNFRGLLQLPSPSFPELFETWLRFFSPIQGRGSGHHEGVTSTPADRSPPLPNLFLPTPSSAASQGGSLAQDHPAPHAAKPLTSSSGERQGQSEPLLWPS